MNIDMSTILAYAIPTVGAVVWGVRLEGRINGHDTLFIERDKQAASNHTDLKERLERIERKLDQATSPAPIHLVEGPK